MTGSPYASAIAQIESEIATINDRRTSLQVALDTLRALDGARPPVAAPTAKPARRGAPLTISSASPAKGRARLTEEQLAAIRKGYERGDNIETLAEATGTNAAVIYYHAKAKKWRRRDSADATPAKTRESAGKAVETPMRTCGSCYQRTRQDPCEHCDVVWKRVA